PKNIRRGGRANTPAVGNQYSDWGVMEMARERPFAAAAAAAGAAAAGLFLWSKRTQISNQLSSLSDQIGEWSQSMGSTDGGWTGGNDTGGIAASTGQRGMRETGRGNGHSGRSSCGRGHY